MVLQGAHVKGVGVQRPIRCRTADAVDFRISIIYWGNSNRLREVALDRLETAEAENRKLRTTESLTSAAESAANSGAGMPTIPQADGAADSSSLSNSTGVGFLSFHWGVTDYTYSVSTDLYSMTPTIRLLKHGPGRRTSPTRATPEGRTPVVVADDNRWQRKTLGSTHHLLHRRLTAFRDMLGVAGRRRVSSLEFKSHTPILTLRAAI